MVIYRKSSYFPALSLLVYLKNKKSNESTNTHLGNSNLETLLGLKPSLVKLERPTRIVLSSQISRAEIHFPVPLINTVDPCPFLYSQLTSGSAFSKSPHAFIHSNPRVHLGFSFPYILATLMSASLTHWKCTALANNNKTFQRNDNLEVVWMSKI